MDIFESLENLSVSESCFEDIISIVEKYINELSDYIVDKVYNKRLENYIKNEETHPETSDKLLKNIELMSKRDKRNGVVNTEGGRKPDIESFKNKFYIEKAIKLMKQAKQK